MGARGPQPGFKAARDAAKAAAAAAVEAAALAAKLETEQAKPAQVSTWTDDKARWPNPLQSGRRLNEMFGEDLRSYARRIGVRPVDVEFLAEERLRQNCALKLREIVESLTE
jgi:hypothetical protein